MWHPLASPRAAEAKAQEQEQHSLIEQHRRARELRRSYAFAAARAQHPSLFLQPRAPSRPEAA